MSQERYFLYLHGIQRGPYTVSQVGHMVNSGIVHSEAMFWCEGLEQWQPVTQLIVPKEEKKRRRIHFGAGTLAVCGAGLVVFWMFLPTLREGWREQHQVQKDAFSAYWRARGVLRESLGWFSGAHFRSFESSAVRLDGMDGAFVELEARVAPLFGTTHTTRWMVALRYDNRLRMWVAADSSSPPESFNPAAAPLPPVPAETE